MQQKRVTGCAQPIGAAMGDRTQGAKLGREKKDGQVYEGRMLLFSGQAPDDMEEGTEHGTAWFDGEKTRAQHRRASAKQLRRIEVLGEAGNEAARNSEGLECSGVLSLTWRWWGRSQVEFDVPPCPRFCRSEVTK